MIKLTKIEKPQVLVENAELWTEEYIGYINGGMEIPHNVKYRYKHDDIKNSLEKETFGKCAYCESKLKHITFGDIEHILPKKPEARPDLYVEWNNLTLSCEVCNRTNKKDYYDSNLPLINPYEDDPEEEFLFLGPMLAAKNGNLRAFMTNSVLELNRVALLTMRYERLASVEKLLICWENNTDSVMKEVLANELRKEYMPDKEYSAFVKHFLMSKGFPV